MSSRTVVHGGGETRDLSVELKRLLLGFCGGGGAWGLIWGRLPCVPPGCCQWSSRPRGRMAFIVRGPCPTITIINSGPDETLNLA
eukprot:6200533-Pleurochrysis_carterae.AAC.1